MELYLLDTDICSYAMKRRSADLQQKIMTFAPGALKVSVITVFELQYGAWRLTETARVRATAAISAFLSNVEILDFDRRAADHAGLIRAQLARTGQPIGAYDLLIAGHACSISAVVVTNNTREFSRIAGLSVENWSTSSR